MQGAKQHVLQDLPESEPIIEEHQSNGLTYTWRFKYRCTGCGRRFQKRISSATCPVGLIASVQAAISRREQLGFRFATTGHDPLIAEILRQDYHWSVPAREHAVEVWKTWRDFQEVAGGPATTK